MRTIQGFDHAKGDYKGKRHEMVEEYGPNNSGRGYDGKTACGKIIKAGVTGGTFSPMALDCERCRKYAESG